MDGETTFDRSRGAEAPGRGAPATAGPRFPRARAAAMFAWKFFLGATLCQWLPGSVLVLGWTMRLMQRVVLKQWWLRSELPRSGASFKSFLAADARTREQVRWPNWFVRQNAWQRIREQAGAAALFRAVPGAAMRSLGQNLKLGAQGIFNVWVFTLPAGVLWLFSWYDGWNNSFNKGYEQAAVGPLTGILGIAWFIAAMFYVPMAQARQAATGQWRSFYQFGFVWTLIRRRWLACLGLAALFSALTLPVMILKTALGFYAQIHPAVATESPAQVAAGLQRYFFSACLVLFPVFVVLRVAAARLYASAVLAAVQSGAVPEDALAEVEWETLHRLDLLHVHSERPRHVLVRLVTWAGTRAGRFTAGVLLVLIWFSLVAQIYVSQFVYYSPVRGWLNQPTVQLPWFNYRPAQLDEPTALQPAERKM